MILYVLYIILFSIQLVFFQNEDPDDIIIQKLTNHSWTNPQEKVYLHTNKSFYAPGEDIWFKAYLMLGPYQIPDTLSGVLYVELIDRDGNLIDRKILHMLRGLGWGDFQLAINIEPGPYILKAYTRYMQNFDPEFYYRKWIHVIQDHQSEATNAIGMGADMPVLNVQFFPEGGNLVAGLQNYIALKATGDKGTGVHVSGIIQNDMGEEVTTFESQKFGFGKFSLRPEAGDRYTAYIEYLGNPYEFELPETMQGGYVMHVSQKEDNVYIWVRNNLGINMAGSFVIGQFRGFPFITINAETDKNYLYSLFSIRDMPTGIIQLTFFDSLGVPQCERLIFSENGADNIQLNIESEKQVFKKREKAEFYLHAEDLSGNFPLTNLSLSIVNNDVVKKKSNQSQISSFFHLESDLKGYIEQPGYYFNNDNEDRLDMLDLLLMTHGWRRFVWKKILHDEYPEIQYPVESGFNILGKVVDYNNMNRTKSGNVRLFIYEGQFYYNEIETDDEGFFEFLGLDIYDSTHIVMQAWEPDEEENKRRKKSVEIRNKLGIKLETFPYASVDPARWPLQDEEESSEMEAFLALNELILTIDSSYDERTIILNELTIRDKRIIEQDPFYRPGKLYNDPTRRIVMDSLPSEEQSLLIFNLIRKYYPNVSYSGMPPDIEVTIRGRRTISGSNAAMLLIDGVQVTSDFLYYFPTTEVAFIDILSSTAAAIYGRDAMSGAIAIYTREKPYPYQVEEEDWVLNIRHPGYYRGREFYLPNYSEPEEKHIKPDYRRTLYWNPSLTTDELGNITFSFYTSDEAAEYRVDVEGMTYDGIPFTKEYYFSVE